MLTRWTVLDYVAHRYGKLEEVFEQDEKRLQLARDGVIKTASLESNPDRIARRMARTFAPQVGLERILGVSDFQDVMILDIIREKSKSICRLLKNGNPIGTGFLVGPSLIITNHHVISNESDADDMVAEFDFELDETLIIRKPKRFRLSAASFFLTSTLEKHGDDPHSGLDFTIIGIEESSIDGESISRYKPMFLDGNIGKIVKGECCVVIQHPAGLPKKVVLTGNAFFSETTTRIVYESDTLPGSSGAAVIALGTGEVIALHHSGLPRTDEQNRIITKFGTLATAHTNDHDIEWIANQGIKVSCIVNAIRHARLQPAWEGKREELLRTTKQVAKALNSGPVHDREVLSGVLYPAKGPDDTKNYLSSETPSNTTMQKSDFIKRP
jgi:endonuclease G, mitochondrial